MTRGFPRHDLLGFFWPSPTDLKVFADRADGGRRLALELERYRDDRAFVLAIPRGGIEVAAEVARALDADLDVTVAKKIPAPGHDELAIGAVTAGGALYLNTDLITALGVTNPALLRAVRSAHTEAIERDRRLRGGAAPPALAGRTVIVIDDGLATGATMTAALRAAKSGGAARVVAAAPVGAPDTCRALRGEADDVVCPEQPELFFAVGAHYATFEQLSDDDAIGLLRAERARKNGQGAAPPP